MFLMPDNKWARLLAYVTGLVNQKLLLQNEYLAAEIASSALTFPPVCAFRIPSDPEWSNYSCGVAVIFEQAAEPRPTTNPLGSCCIAPGGEQKIEAGTGRVHRPIQVRPFAFYADKSFIGSVATLGIVFTEPPAAAGHQCGQESFLPVRG